MAHVELVPFRESDVPFGKRLTDAEGWDRSLADWMRLVRLEPLGFFKAVVDGNDAGMAAVLVYPEVAWVHSVLVDRPYRRAGIGTTLMTACLSYAQGRRVRSVKLDAVQEYMGLYRKVGFREEFVSHRFTVHSSQEGRAIPRITSSDIDDVCSFDLVSTGLDRSAVLRDILADKGCGCSVRRLGGRMLGYVAWRAGGCQSAVGPCVVDPRHPDAVRGLMADAVGAVPGVRCRVCVPGYNAPALELMRSLGAFESPPSTRMCYGPEVVESPACYAMIGPEMG